MTRWQHLGSSMLVAAAGCSGGSSGATIIPDAARSAPDSASSLCGAPVCDVTLTLTDDVPDLYAYKDGAGAWQSVPTPDPGGVSVIHVHDDYLLLAVCAGSGDDFDAVLTAAVWNDGSPPISCVHPASGGSAVAVTGTVAQPGSIQLGDPSATASGSTTPWTFDLPSVGASAAYDLAAFDAAHTRMLVRRDVQVGTTALAITPVLDLTVASEAGALQKPTLSFTGLAADAAVDVDTRLVTSHGAFDLGPGSGVAAVLAPDAILASLDLEQIEIDAMDATGTQTAITRGGAQQFGVEQYDMLAEPTDVTFAHAAGGVAASWATPPTQLDTLSVAVIVTGRGARSQTVTATSGWIAATGASSLQFDPSAPGYQASWIIDPASFVAQLQIAREEPVLDVPTTTLYEASTFDPASTGTRRDALAVTRAHRRAALRAEQHRRARRD